MGIDYSNLIFTLLQNFLMASQTCHSYFSFPYYIMRVREIEGTTFPPILHTVHFPLRQQPEGRLILVHDI